MTSLGYFPGQYNKGHSSILFWANYTAPLANGLASVLKPFFGLLGHVFYTDDLIVPVSTELYNSLIVVVVSLIGWSLLKAVGCDEYSGI